MAAEIKAGNASEASAERLRREDEVRRSSLDQDLVRLNIIIIGSDVIYWNFDFSVLIFKV